MNKNNQFSKKSNKCLFCHDKQSEQYELDCKHHICSNCLRKKMVQTKTKKLLLCQICQNLSYITEDFLKQRLMGKTYKSTQKRRQDNVPQKNSANRELSANNSKATIAYKQIKTSAFQDEAERTCNFHFNQKTHVCATCIRGICIRCLQTLCEDHKVFNRTKGLQIIKKDFISNIYTPKVEETELKFKQLNERKKFYESRYQHANNQIKNNFDHIREILLRKEEQLIQFSKGLYKKIDLEYDRLYQRLDNRMNELNKIKELVLSNSTISIEALKKEIYKVNDLEEMSIEPMHNIELDRIIDQKKLEKILFEIQSIKIEQFKKDRKFRTSTENAERNSLKVFRSIPSTKLINN